MATQDGFRWVTGVCDNRISTVHLSSLPLSLSPRAEDGGGAQHRIGRFCVLGVFAVVGDHRQEAT